jgi:glycosyltransferase involved in cell wall biosynthesis
MRIHPPKLSVVMPCFNHGEFIGEAVASVAAARREDLELIVIDDGSTDERTLREMDRLERQGLRVLRQKNGGLASARNAGITAATSEYIVPLDADDRLRTEWIDQGLAILDRQSTVGVVYGDAQCFGTRSYLWRTGPFYAEPLMHANYIHACALFRRSVWEQNGGYDGTMPTQGLEDWDFWLGALERGWEFSYLPAIFFEYRQRCGSMIASANDVHEQIVEFVAKKHGPLYRKRWLILAQERQSAAKTARRLSKLLNARAKDRFSARKDASWVP